MTIKLIRTEADHAAALARLDVIFDAAPGTPEGDEAEVLAILIQHYEQARFSIGLPDPVAALRFRMEQQELKAKDLIPFIGSASKVSEVLSGHRRLSLRMIRNLVDGLGLPPHVLLPKPSPARRRRPPAAVPPNAACSRRDSRAKSGPTRFAPHARAGSALSSCSSRNWRFISPRCSASAAICVRISG